MDGSREKERRAKQCFGVTVGQREDTGGKRPQQEHAQPRAGGKLGNRDPLQILGDLKAGVDTGKGRGVAPGVNKKKHEKIYRSCLRARPSQAERKRQTRLTCDYCLTSWVQKGWKVGQRDTKHRIAGPHLEATEEFPRLIRPGAPDGGEKFQKSSSGQRPPNN